MSLPGNPAQNVSLLLHFSCVNCVWTSTTKLLFSGCDSVTVLGSPLQHTCDSSDLPLPGRMCSHTPFCDPSRYRVPSARAENCCSSWEVKTLMDKRGRERATGGQGLCENLTGMMPPAWAALPPSHTDHPLPISFSGGRLLKSNGYILKWL